MPENVLSIILFIIFLFIMIRGTYYVIRWILRSTFNRKESDWVDRIFGTHSEVDLKKVNQQVDDGESPMEKINQWEMVAVICKYITKEGASSAIRKIERIGDQGWDEKYNYDFYSVLEQTARKISVQGKKKAARELITIGHRLAEKSREKYWIERFWELLERERSNKAAMKWDRSRRW